MRAGPKIGIGAVVLVGAILGYEVGGGPATTTATATLSDATDPILGGQNEVYTAQFTNTGGVSATSVSCAVTLDASLTWVSQSGTGWSCGHSGQVVTCTRASASVGAAPAITVTATTTNASASISSGVACSGGNFTTATGSQGTTVTASTITTTAVSDGTDPLMGGKGQSYTVQVTNTGGNAASTVSSVTTLDASLAYVSSSGTGWSCGAVVRVVTCTRATLAVGAAPAISISATSTNSTASISTGASTSAANQVAPSTGSASTQVNAVTRDATSGIYLPKTSAEWATVLLQAGIASGGPASSWDFTALASGNASDLIGSNALTVTGASWVYQTAVTGWSSKSLALPDGLANHNAQNLTTIPDIGSTSELVIAVVSMPAAAPAATRRVARWDSTGISFGVTATPKSTFAAAGAGGSTFTGTANPTGAVRPVVMQVNRTAVTTTAWTDQEALTPTFGTYSGLAFGFGSQGSNSCACGYLTAAEWNGSAAEMTSAQLRTLEQTLGWTIAW